MDTAPTTKPARGSVEHYIDMFRRFPGNWRDIDSFVFTLVEDIALAEIVLAPADEGPARTATDADRLQRIRNVVVAGRQVRTELEAAVR